MTAVGRVVALLAMGAIVLGSTMAAPGGARTPGLNGAIAFTSAGPSYQEIYRVEVATGRRTDLTKRRGENGAVRPRDPVASPDGLTILFRVYGSLWRMNSDGSGQQQIGRGEAPAWSPDSKRIAFVDQTGFVATMTADGSDVRRLVRGGAPAWSPDGRSIAYVDGPSVMVVGAGGAEARRIYSATTAQISSPITWSPDSTRVAFWAPEAIVAVPAAGGAPRVLAAGNGGPDRGGPRWSPDGNRIAFARAGRIHTISQTGEELQRTRPAKGLVDGSPVWSPDGQSLAFLRGGGEHSNREVWVIQQTGAARRVKQEDFHARLYGLAWTADSRSLLYSHQLSDDNDRDLYTIEAAGTGLRRLTSNDVDDYDPAFSPDGRMIAFVRDLRPSSEVFNAELFVMRADGTGTRRLTRWSGADTAPSWSPDGSRIVFLREMEEQSGGRLYTIRPDGTHLVRLALRIGAWGDPSWSPDGRLIALTEWLGLNLSVVGADGRNFRQLVAYRHDSDYVALNPEWLPSGDRISFTRAETCKFCEQGGDLWTMSPGGGGARLLVGGVHDAAWSPDGRQFVALNSGYDGRLRIVAANGRPVRRLPAHATGAWLDGFGLSWQPRCSIAGSRHGDRLRARVSGELICGFGGPDRITGGPGRDRLLGGEGADTIDARGGGFDVVGCGAGRDTVHADRADFVGVDCERVTRR